ncbi:MAG: response regulator transcription factor [Lachnospiraceae bacterium]|nr:response regulator transcription factor [Lachnospiraceae bacterium]MBP3352412.1 response regulator transcription factor [Lachnospiraceae bacterium]
MIWCVDDDNTILEIEVYTLKQMGFEARGFTDGLSMLEALGKEIPELIVLDIMMPELDGIEILHKLRSETKYKNIPVIMATAKGTEMDKISGLNSGADDYLVKPFGVMEMVARVKAVLRRTTKDISSENIAIGSISLNEKSHKVIVNGKKVDLTHKEFELLKLFMKNPNMVFTRDTLMSQIWGTDYIGETRTVDMHIKTLRQKLGSAGSQIKTVIGVGYRLENEL